MHKVASTLSALPSSAQAGARRALAEVRDAEDRDHAVMAAKRFEAEYEHPPVLRTPALRW